MKTSSKVTEIDKESLGQSSIFLQLAARRRHDFKRRRASFSTSHKRLTLILSGAEIVKVFYPVFPPDRNAEEVIAWLSDERHDER